MLPESDIFAVYNEKLLRLSAAAEQQEPLAHFDETARVTSPICGSVVTVRLTRRGDHVDKIFFDVEACALTKAVVAVMIKAAPGKTASDIAKAGKVLQDILDGKDAPLPKDWEELDILKSLRDYKARHNAMMLPFEAVAKAFAPA